MKINAPMLYHRIQQYFSVDYAHITQSNLAKAPVFYNDYFDVNKHIVLIRSSDLDKCLQRVQEAIIICLDPPETIPEEAIGSNDLIILNDPMSDKMTFNVLNYILDYYQEFEHSLNEILYKRQSFHDMIEILTDIIELPLALNDANFHYIAYSENSGKYIGKYVTEENVLSEAAIRKLQSDEGFRQLEKIPDSFVYEGAEPLVCKNIYHDGHYVGRLAVIIPDEETDIEFLKAIFNYAAAYIELLYDQYSSFSNTTTEYRRIHESMDLIFRRQPLDRRDFLDLMHRMQIHESQDLIVAALLPRNQDVVMFNHAFTCEHLERRLPGCFCISMDEYIIVLASQTYYHKVTGRSFLEDLRQVLGSSSYLAGISRVFHALDTFEILYSAWQQARYAIEQVQGKGQEDPLCFFNDYALSYLLQHGSGNTNFLQNGHPALITLKEHDDIYGSDYLHTLRVYMDLNMNAVATAKALYIHRSSFIGRMERLNKLVELDLDDPRERLYINLTFAIFL